MTRTRLRGYLERISDVEFQCVEPSIIEAVSKLDLSQLLIDLSHVLGLRSSSKEAADNIEETIVGRTASRERDPSKSLILFFEFQSNRHEVIHVTIVAYLFEKRATFSYLLSTQ